MDVNMTSGSRLKLVCATLCRKHKTVAKDIPTCSVKSREIYYAARLLRGELIDISIYGDAHDPRLDGTFSVGGEDEYLYPIFNITDSEKPILKVWVSKDGKAHFVAMNGDYTATMPLANPEDVYDWIVNYLGSLP